MKLQKIDVLSRSFKKMTGERDRLCYYAILLFHGKRIACFMNTNNSHLTSKCCIHITKFKANITTSHYSYPLGNKFQFECMITGNHSLTYKQLSIASQLSNIADTKSLKGRILKEYKGQGANIDTKTMIKTNRQKILGQRHTLVHEHRERVKWFNQLSSAHTTNMHGPQLLYDIEENQQLIKVEKYVHKMFFYGEAKILC